jgi:hypothetical protein
MHTDLHHSMLRLELETFKRLGAGYSTACMTEPGVSKFAMAGQHCGDQGLHVGVYCAYPWGMLLVQQQPCDEVTVVLRAGSSCELAAVPGHLFSCCPIIYRQHVRPYTWAAISLQSV